jgi:hypothetical protein
MVWEEAGEHQLNRLCEKRRSITKCRGGKKHPTSTKKVKWTGYILHSNYPIKFVMGGKIEGKNKGMGRRGSRSNQLLDDLKWTGSY